MYDNEKGGIYRISRQLIPSSITCFNGISLAGQWWPAFRYSLVRPITLHLMCWSGLYHYTETFCWHRNDQVNVQINIYVTPLAAVSHLDLHCSWFSYLCNSHSNIKNKHFTLSLFKDIWFLILPRWNLLNTLRIVAIHLWNTKAFHLTNYLNRWNTCPKYQAKRVVIFSQFHSFNILLINPQPSRKCACLLVSKAVTR